MSTKFSGSFDEFRLWNKKQSSQAIYNNYYRAIGGGANSDDNRTELSVYYKFNEGTTEIEATDRIVLDYSGRIANGYWELYAATNRETGSAYTTTGDPIVRTQNTLISDLETEMETSGTLFDSNNNMSMFDLYPRWIQDEDNGELKKLTQIIAAYFDSLYAKIEYLPKLKDKRYFKDTEKAMPFAKRLLEEKGLIVPDILVDRSILEYFGQRDSSKIEFEKDIEEIKNKIYHNIYNNLEYIYKSKGTEKSYRNMLRCFGIDDEIVKLNLYTDNGTQYLVDKTKHTSEKTKHVDFDEVANFSATVYQENYISGSDVSKLERYNAITAEAEVMVPKKPDPSDSWYYSTPFQSSSVFGIDAVDTAGTAYDSTIDGSNLQAYLVRDRLNSDRAKWVLENNSVVTSVVEQSSSALIINETGEYYSSTLGLIHAGTALTVTMWVNFKNNDDSDQRFFEFQSGSVYVGLDYNGQSAEPMLLRKHNSIQTWNSPWFRMERIDDTTADEWTLVALTVDTITNPSSYLDFTVQTVNATNGYQTSTPKDNYSQTDVIDFSAIETIKFGSVRAETTGFSGSIDEVVIWSKALTQTDVEDIYNSGLQQDLTARGDYSYVKYWLRLGGDLTTTVGSPDVSAGSGTPTYEQHDSLPYEYILYQHVPTSQVLLESPFYEEIYNNQRWNIAARISPEGYPFAGSFATSSNPNYNVEFYGVTHNMNEVLHEFDLSTTFNYATGSGLLSANKKLYVGARRANWTGTVEAKSDLKIAAASVYYDRLDNKSIRQHNLDPSNYGHNRVHSSPTPFIKDMENTHLPAQHTLALHWDFQTVTSSDSSGEFTVEDFSSASSENRYGWLDGVVTNEYKGTGYGFPTSSTDVVRNEFIFASKKELPEISFTSDSIQIIGDEEVFLYEDEDVNDNVFAFEKSMYQSVSEEMLNLFSTITEFSNLISKPVDRYRMDYKRLAYARQLFFEKVDGNMDLDRFTDYFKWIDASISVFLQQLHPANAKFNKGISDMVESHILERPKYQHIYPFVQRQTEIKPGQIKGPGERLYNWKFGHAPDYKQAEYNTKSIQIEYGSKLEHSSASAYTTTNTIAFWFHPADNTNKIIVAFGLKYKIKFDSNNLTVFKGAETSTTTITINPIGNTSFVAVSLNDSTVKWSVDGSPFSLAMAFGSATVPDLTGAFIIGEDSIKDKFDEITIWNKVLDDTEIAELYNSGDAMDVLADHSAAANVVSYYRMGDHSGDPEIRPFKGYYLQDSTENYNLQVKGTWSSYADPLAGSFRIANSSENIHCLWHKEREERVADSTRDLVQKTLTTNVSGIKLTLGDPATPGNSYVGSTYASRRFAKPYSFKGEEQRTIHGGINYAPSKDRDFLKTATKVHGELSTGGTAVPVEVVTVGAGLAQGIIDQIPCEDVISPTAKQKLTSNAVLGKYSNVDGTGPTDSLVAFNVEYAYSVKGERILPMNIVEATSLTGYNRKIHYDFREGVMITNLHSDTTSPTNEIPMQSPFTNTWVGGRQSRHVALNRYQSSLSTTNNIDDEYTRPEEWRLLIGEHEVDDTVDGALGFTGPDYGGATYPNVQRQWAIHFRDGRAKRPVNVANHKTTDFFQGNYSHNYEVVQTVGRLENNIELRQDTFEATSHDFGLPATTNETTLIGVSASANGNIQSAESNRYSEEMRGHKSIEQHDPASPRPDRKSVFASKFSAPGSYETMSEAYLDAYGREYSVYNSLNFRNYSVIEDSGEESIDIQTYFKAIQGPAGINDNLRVSGTITGFPSTGGLSINFWIKLMNGEPERRIMIDSDSFKVELEDNKFRFRATNSVDVSNTWEWPVILSNFSDWKQIIVSWSGDFGQNPAFYINADDQGAPVATGEATGTTRKDLTLLSLFDDYDTESLLYELQGSMMEMMLWNTAVSANYAETIYNDGGDFFDPTGESDLMLYYRLGEESTLDDFTYGEMIDANISIAPTVDNTGGSPDNTLLTDHHLIITSGVFRDPSTTTTITQIRVDSHSERREGLNTLHARHCGQFGVDSEHGTISAAHYDVEPSFHKIHRNTLVVPTDGSTREIHNNFYVQSPIPASDYNYSWVTSSLGSNYSVSSGTQKVYGYWPKDGILSSSSGFDSAIVFPTASEIFGS